MAAKRFSVHFYHEDLVAIETHRHAMAFTTQSKAIRDLILKATPYLLKAQPGLLRGQSVSVSVDEEAWQRIEQLRQATGMGRGQLVRAIVRATAAMAASPQVGVEA